MSPASELDGVVYATAGLVDSLRRMAEDADPDPVTTPVATTPAGEIPDCDLDPEVPVFTHFYMPNAGHSVSFVFGYDLGTPVGGAQGQFVSHPEGNLGVTREDDLREVVFVAVPPWERSSVAAFDRRGDRLELTVLDVEPPEEVLEEP